MGTITVGGGGGRGVTVKDSVIGRTQSLTAACNSLTAPPLLNPASTICHRGNCSQRSQHLRGMVSGIKNKVSCLDTPPTQLADTHQHRHHLQCAMLPTVSHTYADQKPSPQPLYTWITSAEAEKLQDHSSRAQTCKHGDVLTFKVSGENLTSCQVHRSVVHIEDNSHTTRSVNKDDSWLLDKAMNQEDGNINAMVANTGGLWCPVSAATDMESKKTS